MSISSIGNIGTRNIGYTSPLDATSVASAQDPDGDGDSDGSGVSRTKDQFRGDFASMLEAVKAGDMTTAQSALSTLQSDLQASSYAPSSSSSSATSGTSARQTDLDSLFQAVKSGDLSGAQTALASLQSDAQTNQAAPTSQQASQAHGHHHHHHGGGMKSAVESALSSIQSSADGSSDTSTSSSTSSTSTQS